MKRVAAIDCGTNSIRLLIAEVNHGALVDLVRETRITKLGQGVDKTGEFAPEALARSLDVIEEYAALVNEYQVSRVRFVATSATRDAKNRDVFVASVRELLCVEPEVVPGAVEAELSFRGAISVLSESDPKPALVIDLGGGSTELVIGVASPDAAYSMDVGCVRLTERHQITGPVTQQQRDDIAADVRAQLALATEHVDLSAVNTVIGVAGTVTTITAHALGLPRYDRDKINGAKFSLAQSRQAAIELATMPTEQLRALPYMHPGRVGVMPVGAIVWDTILGAIAEATADRDVNVITSEHDILDGTALNIGGVDD